MSGSVTPASDRSPLSKVSAQNLTIITSPWTFGQWDLDIIGPLPTTLAQKKLLLVAIDYFSKWIEVEAFASIKDKEVVQFVWKNIVCRFGIPKLIITDNGPQFDSHVYRNFCNELKIKNLYSTPRYPQSNGLEKVANKTLLSTLKKRPEFGQRKMGRGTTIGFMGLQNNQPETNWRIAIHPHVWDGSHHPHKNQDAHHKSRNS